MKAIGQFAENKQLSKELFQMDQDHEHEHEPTIAPSIDTHNSLEEDASQEEIEAGDATEVTHLFLDRTPNE
jgi:hypothetical protein